MIITYLTASRLTGIQPQYIHRRHHDDDTSPLPKCVSQEVDARFVTLFEFEAHPGQSDVVSDVVLANMIENSGASYTVYTDEAGTTNYVYEQQMGYIIVYAITNEPRHYIYFIDCQEKS